MKSLSDCRLVCRLSVWLVWYCLLPAAALLWVAPAAPSDEPVEEPGAGPWTRVRPLSVRPAVIPPARPGTGVRPDPAGPARVLAVGRRQILLYPDIPVHPNPGHHQTELSTAVHPNDPDILLAGSNSATTDIVVGSQGWYYTTDAGASWLGSDTLPTHTDLAGKFWTDPAVAIDLDGYLYFNAIEFGGGAELYTLRSTDGGATWTQVAVPDPRAGEDKNHLVIDVEPTSPHVNNVYTAYTDFAERPPSPILLSRSTDRGLSFSSPEVISGSIGSRFGQGVNLATGPAGELYAAWSGYNEFPPDSTRLGFTRSFDGGVTWDTARSLRWVQDLRGFLSKGADEIRVNSYPVVDVDRSDGARRGWLYMVFAEKSPVRPDVYLIRSSDQGATWSEPRRVHQDSATGDQWFPWLAVDPSTGGLFVVYYDSRRFPANDSAEIWVSMSFDGGETFEDLRISDMSFKPAPIPGLATGYMGDYIGIAALDGVVWPVWNDDRTGVHQAYTARMDVVDVGAAPTLSRSPDTVAFGAVFIGYPGTRELVVRNRAFPDTLIVSRMTATDPAFGLDSSALTLPGGGVRRVQVQFDPPAAGSFQGWLRLESNDPARPVDSVVLTGRGLEPPSVILEPDSLTDSLDHADMVARDLRIRNDGPGVLEYWLEVENEQTPVARATSGSPRPAAWGPPPPVSLPSHLGLAAASGGRPVPQALYEQMWADSLPLIVADPEGDAVGVDVRAIRARVFLDTLFVVLEFAHPIDTADFGGYLSCDLDRNRATGEPPFFGKSGQDIGAEVEFSFFDLPRQMVILEDAFSGAALDSVPALVLANEVRFFISLDRLGDDGELDVTGVYGTSDGPTDWIPDAGHGTIPGVTWLTVDPAGGTLDAGRDTTIRVTLDAGGLFSGDYRRRIVVLSNDPARPRVDVPVHLQVAGTPLLALPDSATFDSVFVGFPETTAVMLQNVGTAELLISDVQSGDPRFVPLQDSLLVAPGRSGALLVLFDPQQPGASGADLVVTSNDTTRPVQHVTLTGIGVWPPELSISPDTVSVSLRLGESTSVPVWIRNTGPGVLTWSVSFPLPLPVFTFVPSSGETPPGDSALLTLEIDSSPLDDGQFALNVLIESNDPRARARVLLVLADVIGIRPGDLNADFKIDARDIIELVNVVFRGGPEPPTGAGDVDCDNAVTLTDILLLVEHVFLSGAVPACP